MFSCRILLSAKALKLNLVEYVTSVRVDFWHRCIVGNHVFWLLLLWKMNGSQNCNEHSHFVIIPAPPKAALILFCCLLCVSSMSPLTGQYAGLCCLAGLWETNQAMSKTHAELPSPRTVWVTWEMRWSSVLLSRRWKDLLVTKAMLRSPTLAGVGQVQPGGEQAWTGMSLPDSQHRLLPRKCTRPSGHSSP